jgi:hypothetical protein
LAGPATNITLFDKSSRSRGFFHDRADPLVGRAQYVRTGCPETADATRGARFRPLVRGAGAKVDSLRVFETHYYVPGLRRALEVEQTEAREGSPDA